MKVWWRLDELQDSERVLLDAVLRAHYNSCFRDNISSTAVRLAYAGSKNYCNAIAAALVSLGEVHGPITRTVAFLLHGPNPAIEAKRLLNLGEKLPGWGNSFVKENKDPTWLNVDQLLEVGFRGTWDKLESVTKVLHKAGKILYPNPSAYTAAAAIALGLPAGYAPWLFVMGRLDGWSELMLSGLRKGSS